MALKLLSWNIEGRLSPFAIKGRGTPEQILSEIIAHDADVVFLPEAADGDEIAPEIIDKLESFGYTIHTVIYNDSGPRPFAAEQIPVMKLLTRVPVANFRQLRLGDVRNALVADITDQKNNTMIRLYGLHLDDYSETNRLLQIETLLEYLKDDTLPVVAMGDLNAMHATDLPARLAHNVFTKQIVKLVPPTAFKDIVRRIYEMGSGTALEKLETQSGLTDVDSRHRPTSTPKLRGHEWLPSIRLVQIDHIYVSSNVRTVDFQIAKHDGGSDHRALSVYVEAVSDKH